MKAKKIYGVPEQTKGAFHDTEDQKDFIVPEIAARKFNILKERFFLSTIGKIIVVNCHQNLSFMIHQDHM